MEILFQIPTAFSQHYNTFHQDLELGYTSIFRTGAGQPIGLFPAFIFHNTNMNPQILADVI
jgi:hypothetical protein